MRHLSLDWPDQESEVNATSQRSVWSKAGSLPDIKYSEALLGYLNYLIAEPIAAAILYRSGVLIQVPRPERFAIHKLIVADRRRGGPNRLKSQKDLKQADVLIRVLSEDRPEELRAAYEIALESGPQWRKHIEASLDKLPDASAALSLLRET